MKSPFSSDATATLLAKSILRDRAVRRKWLGSCAFILVMGVAAGTTIFTTWLAQSSWRFLFYWLAIVGWIFLVIVFALYDLLRVFREERERMK